MFRPLSLMIVVAWVVSFPPCAVGDDSATIKMSGVVTDGEGRPVEGATLRIARREWHPPGYSMQRFLNESETSGRDGRFVVQFARSGSSTVVATFSDSIGVPTPQPVFSGRRELDVVVQAPVELQGRVVNEQGVPVSGARVAPHCYGLNDGLLPDSDLIMAATTDEDGVFRAAWPEYANDMIIVVHSDYASLLVALGRDGAGSTEFVLKRGRQLRGRVLSGADGIGVAGIQVICVPGTHVGIQSAVTDDLGRFELRGLTDGYARLSVGDSGWVLAGTPMELDIDGESTQEDVYLDVSQTGVVTGRVFNSATNAGISGVRVRVAQRASELTAADGSYRVEGVRPGEQMLYVKGEDDRSLCPEEEMPRAQVQSGETTVVDISLAPATPIFGRVVDVKGMPIEGARVMGRCEDGGGSLSDSGPDGTFEVYGCEVGATLELHATCHGYLSMDTHVEVSAEGLPDPTIVLPIAGTVRGRVWDAAGNPFPHVSIYMADEEVLRQVFTDNDGRFELACVAPGRQTICTWLIGHGTEDIRSEIDVDVAAGDVTELDMRLPVVERNIASGWLRDDRGRPVAGATVAPWTQFGTISAWIPTAMTDSRGYFSLQYFGPGPCNVSTSVDGYERLPERTELENGEIVLQLKRRAVAVSENER